MGCTGSSEDVVDDEEEKRRQMAHGQRRRLSVAPEQVGDISTQHVEEAEPGIKSDDVRMGDSQGCVFATDTNKGFVPYNRNKVNQDRAVAVQSLGGNPDVQLYGVMDGHGEFGHKVAELCQGQLPEYLQKQPDLLENTAEAMDRAVMELCDELRDSRIVTAYSGTTCVFSLLIRDKETGKRFMHVGNIGDSRCVLAQRVEGKLVTKDLSFDQKPDNPEEKKRILAAGGRVAPLPGPPGEDTGPFRVWLATENIPGLAMSRSLGDDVSHTVGVIPNPEVHKYEIDDTAEFAIWASDGVWEFIASQEAVTLVDKVLKKKAKLDKKDALLAACKALSFESSNRWRSEEDVIDDITCVIVYFTKG